MTQPDYPKQDGVGGGKPPQPPSDCNCLSFWTVNGEHRKGCLLYNSASVSAASPKTSDYPELDEILRSLLDFSPSRFQRQMKDGTVKQLSGMDVFNEVKSQISALMIRERVDEVKRLPEHFVGTIEQHFAPDDGMNAEMTGHGAHDLVQFYADDRQKELEAQLSASTPVMGVDFGYPSDPSILPHKKGSDAKEKP